MNTIAHLKNFTQLLPELALTLGLVALIITLTAFALRLCNWWRLVNRKLVFLELTPPAVMSRTADATQQLFSVIHGQRAARSWQDKLLRHPVVVALEMVSTLEGGVRYLTQVEPRLATSVPQAITAYLPDIKVAEVSDFLLPTTHNRQVIEFKQIGHYAFPLAPQISLDQHDPVDYLANAMTKLALNGLISFQIILTPVHLREASILAHKIMGNEDVLARLGGQRKLPLWSGLLRGINTMLFGLLDGVSAVHHTPSKQSFSIAQRDAHEQLQVAKRLKPARTLSSFEQQLMGSMQAKLNQPLFQVSVRVMVTTDSAQETRERIGAIKSSLAAYSVSSYQGLQAKIRLPFTNTYRQFVFARRLPPLFRRQASVLSASEVASLYHFPLGQTSKTDNLVTSLSRTLSAPLSLKNGTPLDIVLGENQHHGITTPIGLTEKERERHVYIIGGTGNGKTTMLQYAIVQDMKNDKGLAVVDPHGDLAETILRHVPDDRLKEVIYFNPDDLARPVGLNLLELSSDLKDDELLREKDLITESTVSIFRKIFSEDDSGGHRIEYILRNAVQTALTVEGATLFTIYDLLNNPDYRKRVMVTLEDQHLKNFWRNEFGKAGGMQRVKMAAGITAKIGRFLFSASAKRILEQPKSTIDFDEIINDGKILICNFSKGILGEDTSELFGITVLAKLQLASLRRARLRQVERRPFFLYVDEFQNFATMSFVQMLSESRKYKLCLLMAEQSTSQQDDQRMVNIILANVGTVVCFRTGNPADEQAVLPMFTPSIKAGEIANLAAFNYYIRIAAIHSQEPLSGVTILLDNNGSEEVAQEIIEHSRTTFAIDYQKSQVKGKAQKAKAGEATAKRALPGTVEQNS